MVALFRTVACVECLLWGSISSPAEPLLTSCGLSLQDIVARIVAHSDTFDAKTTFSQDKYLERKRKKWAREGVPALRGWPCLT